MTSSDVTMARASATLLSVMDEWSVQTVAMSSTVHQPAKVSSAMTVNVSATLPSATTSRTATTAVTRTTALASVRMMNSDVCKVNNVYL